MLKRIPKSDISIRPFKAYKEWDKASAGVTLLEALDGDYTSNDANTITTGLLSGSVYNKYSVFGQLRAQFYNGKENDPFYRLGSKTNVYDETDPERFLSGSAKVISIPQNCIGDGIKKGSFQLITNGSYYVDDMYSNLIKSGTTHKPIQLSPYLLEYVQANPETKIYVGSDSQNRGPETVYCTAVVLRYRSRGCHVLYHKTKVPIVRDFWSRLWRETEMSIETALFIVENSPLKIESIDLDFNDDEYKASNKLVAASKGWVQASGFKSTTKPALQIATRAADHAIRV